MGFNKKEFLERIMKALETAINEYADDMEKDEADIKFSIFEAFNNMRKVNGTVVVYNSYATPIVKTIFKYDPAGETEVTNFIVDLLNAPESVIKGCGPSMHIAFRVPDNLANVWVLRVDLIKKLVNEFPYAKEELTVCLQDMMALKGDPDSYFEAVKDIATATVKYLTDKAGIDIESHNSKPSTTTYEFTYEELEKAYRDKVFPEQMKMAKRQCKNPMFDTQKVNLEVVEFVADICILAHSSTIFNKDAAIKLAKKYINILSKTLKCDVNRDSFQYLISKFRDMVNVNLDDDELLMQKKIVLAIVDFLKAENLMMNGMLDPNQPVEYIYYKTHNMYFPTKFDED